MDASVTDADSASADAGGSGDSLAFDELISLPCRFPATKFDVVDFEQARGLVGIVPSHAFVCPNAFEDHVRSFSISERPTDLWVGSLFKDKDEPDVVVSTLEGIVFIRLDSERERREALVSGPSFLTGADVTSNGQTDLLFVSELISLLEQREPGEFREVELNADVAAAENAIFPDLDGNGLPAVVSIIGDGSDLAVSTHPYAGQPQSRAVALEGGPGSGSLVQTRRAAGELPDVVVDTERGVMLLENDEGTLAEAVFVDVNLGGPLAAGDLTGDGADEIVGVDAFGDITLFARHDGDLAHVMTLPYDEETPIRAILLTDFDRDGSADIVVAAGSSLLAWYRQLQP